ncbi:MAG: phospholipid carrier-dependent glycosyltransferase, partial [Bdellovibrionales bacterium]|nr:phospholipid carrier-dependent glycosyltransferase [Bdellovibrionales bacterium]
MNGQRCSVNSMSDSKRISLVLLLVILCAATYLRFWGLGFRLPYLQHPDEPNKIIMAQKMFKSGYYNPEWFKKPSLFIYLNTAMYVPYYVAGRFSGKFQSREDIPAPKWLTGGVGKVDDSMVVYMARGLTAIFGVLAVLMMYLIATHLSRERYVGLVAAALLAVSPTHTVQSRFLTPDMFLVFFILLFLYFCLLLYERGTWKTYLFAGLALGLVVSTKYKRAVA